MSKNEQETYMELMDVHDDDEQPKNNKPELINNAHVTMDSNQQKEKEKEQEKDQEQEKDKGEKQLENSKVTGKRKPTRPESWVWSHFTLMEGCDPEFPRATCNWCGFDYACHKKRNGTSNMATHLEERCKKFGARDTDPKQPKLSFQPKKKKKEKVVELV
ncbi:uncharacterized protein LOC129290171 [Prosopis cineraria]|uniref:uncharacterized protein LOC129290171 n=1 Tax=Prosopis cineraria TaxID=364024 RepID=UPI00240EE9EE|nr:uncharacterized protein LOC129290171 [Prosopis cineraria]